MSEQLEDANTKGKKHLHCYADYRDCLGWKEQYEYEDIPDEWKMKAGCYKGKGKGKGKDASSASSSNGDSAQMRQAINQIKKNIEDLRVKLNELAEGKSSASSSAVQKNDEKKDGWVIPADETTTRKD